MTRLVDACDDACIVVSQPEKERIHGCTGHRVISVMLGPNNFPGTGDQESPSRDAETLPKDPQLLEGSYCIKIYLSAGMRKYVGGDYQNGNL